MRNAGSRTKTTKPDTPGLSQEDRELFRRAMRFVQPLHGAPARAPVAAVPVPAAQARQRRARASGETAAGVRHAVADSAALADWYDEDATQFLRPGHGPDLLRGLRRHKWPVGATLDLHGSTLEQMDERLHGFLDSCRSHGIRCVCIVHGKGHGSRSGVGVLKSATRRRLRQLDAVQAWLQCQEADGGAGAVLVLIRPADGAGADCR